MKMKVGGEVKVDEIHDSGYFDLIAFSYIMYVVHATTRLFYLFWIYGYKECFIS